MALPTTHSVVVIFLFKILGLTGLSGWAQAIGFGVMVDADHFLSWNYLRYRVAPKFMEFTGIKPQFLRKWTEEHTRKLEQKFNHLFQFHLLVIPFTVYGLITSNWLPLIFWGSHKALDCLLAIEQKPLEPFYNWTAYIGFWPSMSRKEAIISAIALVIVIITLILF